MTKCGLLIRGGLTVGELYHDENIVYGPAMIRAYEMENKMAIYPRIIVDMKAFAQYCSNYIDDSVKTSKILSLIECDQDGMLFIDMLRQSTGFYLEGYYHWLVDIRSIVVEGLKNDDLSVLMKYRWFKNYFNAVVLDGGLSYPECDDKSLKEIESVRNRFRELKI